MENTLENFVFSKTAGLQPVNSQNMNFLAGTFQRFLNFIALYEIKITLVTKFEIKINKKFPKMASFQIKKAETLKRVIFVHFLRFSRQYFNVYR